MIENIILTVAILVIFLCGIGFVICMAMFADRVDDLIKGGHDNEDKQQGI